MNTIKNVNDQNKVKKKWYTEKSYSQYKYKVFIKTNKCILKIKNSTKLRMSAQY